MQVEVKEYEVHEKEYPFEILRNGKKIVGVRISESFRKTLKKMGYDPSDADVKMLGKWQGADDKEETIIDLQVTRREVCEGCEKCKKEEVEHEK